MNIDSKAFEVVGWIGVAALAVGTAFVAARGDWSGLAVIGGFLAASIAFVGFERRLPSLFDALFVTAAILNAAGWVWHIYKPVWGYDELAHFTTIFAVTLSLGYLSFYAMRRHFSVHRWHFALVVTSFGVTIGAWWEVAEWLVMGKLADPVGDIVVDSLGALAAAGVAAWALGKEAPANTPGEGSDRTG